MAELANTGERVIEPESCQHDINYLRHMTAYTFAMQFVKDKLVLEDGCGSGYGSYYLATNGAKKVVGIDVAAEAVEYARNRYRRENLEFVQMNSTELSFSDESFDVATSFQVIEHIEDFDKFLRQIVRVLKKQGTALISTPNKQTYSPGTTVPENPFHVKEFYPAEFRELLQQHFGEVDILGINQSSRMETIEKAVESSLRNRVKKLLRKIGLGFLLKKVPKWLTADPYAGKGINGSDFMVAKCDPAKAIDLIAICRKK
jgi:ubiquinone/menaquinone biosynthesis C-methylase UbiE